MVHLWIGPGFGDSFPKQSMKARSPRLAKSTYLLELLEHKVKHSAEALPFSSEGCNRAKAILSDKYGKEPEIVKCYVKKILDLTTITSASPHKVAGFYDQHFHSIQALKTMEKLDQISGNVSLILEKLQESGGFSSR